MQLTPNNVIKGIDGNQWIKTLREKTDIAVNVPLLPKALTIVEKYKDHPWSIAHGTVELEGFYNYVVFEQSNNLQYSLSSLVFH